MQLHYVIGFKFDLIEYCRLEIGSWLNLMSLTKGKRQDL